MSDKNSRFYPLARTDSAQIAPASDVDLNTGCSYDPQADAIVPSREPISRPSTLGDANGPARLVGDMVAGMPDVNDNTVTDDLGPILKLPDTRTAVPQRAGRLEP
jgi:hypothetical protein